MLDKNHFYFFISFAHQFWYKFISIQISIMNQVMRKNILKTQFSILLIILLLEVAICQRPTTTITRSTTSTPSTLINATETYQTSSNPSSVSPTQTSQVTTTTTQNIQPTNTSQIKSTTVTTTTNTNRRLNPKSPNSQPFQSQPPTEIVKQPQKQQVNTQNQQKFGRRRNNKTRSRNQSSNNSSGIITTVFLFSDGKASNKLQNYSIADLNQTQQNVDKFIRKQSGMGNQANLTKAFGNGKQFKYEYERKNENQTKNWVIFVAQKNDHHSNNTQNGTEQNKTGDKKYVITGLNYVENAKMTEEQKGEYKLIRKAIKKEVKKRQKQMRRFQREMQRFQQKMQNLRKNGQYINRGRPSYDQDYQWF